MAIGGSFSGAAETPLRGSPSGARHCRGGKNEHHPRAIGAILSSKFQAPSPIPPCETSLKLQWNTRAITGFWSLNFGGSLVLGASALGRPSALGRGRAAYSDGLSDFGFSQRLLPPSPWLWRDKHVGGHEIYGALAQGIEK